MQLFSQALIAEYHPAITALIDLRANTAFAVFQCDTLAHCHQVTSGKLLMEPYKNVLFSLVLA